MFREVCKVHDYQRGKRPIPTVDCGGHLFSDTPAALYRAMYLGMPKQIDFSDMYKGGLVDFCSPCYRFVASFSLWKYEAGFYFGCARECAEGRPDEIRGGWPSCDNGVRCKSELGNKWFSAIVKALERSWDVYPGNDFVV